MFKQNGKYISNKDEQFLKNSDLIIGWKKEAPIKFDENQADEKLALLLSRLAYVFDLVDENVKKHQDYEDFIDILKGVRIKKTLQERDLTLPQIADILSQIQEAKQVSILIDEDDYDTIRYIIAFGAVMGLDKVGLYFDELDDDFNEFKLVD